MDIPALGDGRKRFSIRADSFIRQFMFILASANLFMSITAMKVIKNYIIINYPWIGGYFSTRFVIDSCPFGSALVFSGINIATIYILCLYNITMNVRNWTSEYHAYYTSMIDD